MTIGESLKRERKKQNLTLDDVAKATKIAKIFLIALENDDISSLPQGIYARNFLRTYAHCLNMDVDIITAEYHEQFNVKPHFVSQQEQTKMDDQFFRKERRKYRLVLFLVIVVLAVVVYFAVVKGEKWLSLGANGQASTVAADTGGDGFGLFSANDRDAAAPVEVEPQAPERANLEAARPDLAEPPTPVQTTVESTGALQETHEPAAAAPGEIDADLDLGQADEPAADAVASEPPVEPTEPVFLPIEGDEELVLLPEAGGPVALAELFAVEALGPVLVKVVVDGEIVTERTLVAGQVRRYRFGERNSLAVSDVALVAIQSGASFRSPAGMERRSVSLRNFGPGELLAALDAALKEPPAPAVE